MQAAFENALNKKFKETKEELWTEECARIAEKELKERLLGETHSELKAKAFGLYGTFTELNMKEKDRALENELVRHLHIKYDNVKIQLELKTTEFNLLNEMLTEV